MKAKPEASWSTFTRQAPKLMEFGVVGLVGGGLGGAMSLGRRTGVRFWAVAVAAGGAVTLGGLALGDAQGPAELILASLVVGWLLGALLGVAGATSARAMQPVVDSVASKWSQPLSRVVMNIVLWSLFWGVFTALASVLAFGVILLSVGIGGAQTIPAIAVGASFGAVLAGAQWAIMARRIASD
jgi:hypothetical protein